MKSISILQKQNPQPFDINIENLSPQQIRLIKSCLVSLAEVSRTTKEEEYFELTSELFQILANIIKHAHFPAQAAISSKIPYAEQALELSIETLNDLLYCQVLKKYDQ